MTIFENGAAAPRDRYCGLRRSTSRLALLAGTVGLAALSSTAQAQCVEGPPNSFTCSGPTDDPQVLTGLDPVVVTTPGFAVDTTGNGNGLALTVTGDGAVSYTDLQASELQGAGVAFHSTGDNGLSEGGITVFSDGAIVASGTQALQLENAGSGDINVVWNGAITNNAGDGVFAFGESGSSDIALTLGDVLARGDAIAVKYQGSGTASLTATGTVASLTGTAVDIQVNTGTTDLMVNLGRVIGGTDGIVIENLGTGATSLTVTGPISFALGADTGRGIDVLNWTNATDLTISAADVQGVGTAVYARNVGTGHTQITVSGLVESETDDGVFAYNDESTGTLIITTAEVHGGDSGIVAEQGGTGDVVVTANGLVTGETGHGVFTSSGLTAQNLIVTTQEARGGSYGIEVNNAGLGETLVNATGAVFGGAHDAIRATNINQSTNLTVLATDTQGRENGINVENSGTGFTRVVSSGMANGAAGAGIFIISGVQSSSISVDAATVAGGTQGIGVANQGNGATSISASGPVSGGTSSGISVFNDVNATDLTINAAAVSGASGISVTNVGTGVTQLTATGAVTGADTDGIRAGTGAGSTDLLIDAASVSGGTDGIDVDHSGSGFLRIRATGSVSGQTSNGIDINTETGTQSVRIEAAAVTGGNRGILVAHRGAGTVGVIVGAVTSGTNGIDVQTDVLGSDILIDSAAVTAGATGIRVVNAGTGATVINAAGPVVGDSAVGINAVNGIAASDLRIAVSDVRGADAGIVASNTGTGVVRVTSTGSIIATDAAGVGIAAFAGANTSEVTIDVTNVRGGSGGISTFNTGPGATVIVTRGVVQGGTNAIRAETTGGEFIQITNSGTIRNSSGQSLDRAITAIGSMIGIGNAGTLTGTLDVSGTESFIVNGGTWNSIGGSNVFAGASDELTNLSTGVIVGGSGAGSIDTTSWLGLERFTNIGRINLRDGGVGDRVQTSANTVFATGSVLAVDIGGASGADVFRTTGNVAIQPGSVLSVNMVQPLTLNGKHVVVDAAGGLTGQFVFADQFLTAFAGLRDGYTPTTAFVEFAQLRDLADAGLTPNQKETAAGADSLPDGNAVKDALLLLPSDAVAQDAFDQLSGEIHPSVRTVLVEDSRLPRNAVLARLSDGQAGGALWGQAFSNWGTSDGDRNAAKVRRDTHGFLIGADVGLGENVILGLAGGYLDTDLTVRARNSSGSAKTVHGLAYVGGRFGGFGIKAGAGYARADIDTRRAVAFPGFGNTLTADYKGTLLQGFAEMGYQLPLGGGHVEPFANVTVLRAKTDAFVESGGAAALAGARATEDSTVVTLGARFETASAGAFSMGGVIGWQHGFGRLDPVGVHRFAGGDPFTILGAAQSRNAGIANVEARFRLSPNVSIGVSYDGVLGTAGQDHAVKGALRIVF
ncbi:autotransporter domain-containing protein [Sphingomonas sp. ZT3P38]|uniref:autotransporter domain-containing protein n=1 Tax=Parasphingomonas zepuensis TaxID=3096161 RepID=UPI002FCABEEB